MPFAMQNQRNSIGINKKFKTTPHRIRTQKILANRSCLKKKPPKTAARCGGGFTSRISGSGKRWMHGFCCGLRTGYVCFWHFIQSDFLFLFRRIFHKSSGAEYLADTG